MFLNSILSLRPILHLNYWIYCPVEAIHLKIRCSVFVVMYHKFTERDKDIIPTLQLGKDYKIKRIKWEISDVS